MQWDASATGKSFNPSISGFFIYCFALVTAAAVDVALAQPVELDTGAEVETVYSWAKDRCADDFIPDAPTRAFRKSDGTLVLMAAHYSNSIFEGASFSSLKPNCSVKSLGSENANPSQFNDRFWVEALAPGHGGQIIALLSHEYQGKRHPGNCVDAKKPGPRCWYSSILLGSGSERDFKFSLLPMDQRIVAVPSEKFDPKMTERLGYFTTTNIVRWGEYMYFLSWGENGKLKGNCLFRTKMGSPAGPWLALKDGKFQERFENPYVRNGDSEHCDIIGRGVLGTMRSVVRLEGKNIFLGVFSAATGSASQPGTYYSLSSNLVDWSEPKLLFSGKPWYGTNGCGEFYDYPSLIDHLSLSPIFDTAAKDLYLYLTRYNWQDCNTGLNRDLVRIKIGIKSLPQ